MIFNQNRRSLRKTYQDAFQKLELKQPMTALESQIADVLSDHPEYHRMVNESLDKDFLPEAGETNPFIHMSLHLAVRDQIKTNRPNGIGTLYKQLLSREEDPHSAEHVLCEMMGEELWRAQREGKMPDEQRYFQQINEYLLKK